MKLPDLTNEKCNICTHLFAIILIISSLGLVLIASLSEKTSTTDSLFNVSLFIIAVLSSYLVIHFSSARNTNTVWLFISVLFALFCLRLLMSIMTSPDILWGPDLKYEFQIITNIDSSGHLMTGTFTGEATSYRNYPGLELNILSLSMIAGFSAVALLKYLGAFFGIFFVILAERFFYGIFKDRAISMPSAIIVGFCPFLVGINSFTIHQSLGIIFLCIFIWGVVKPGWRWKIASGIAVTGIFITHSLTTYLVILVIGLILFYYIVSSRLLTTSDRPKISKKHALISLGIFIALVLIVIYLTPPEVSRGLDRVWSSIISNIFAPESFSLSTLLPVSSKPIWMVLLQYLGFFVFGLSATYFILSTFRKKNKTDILPFTFGLVGITMFVGFLFIWVSGVSFAKELRWRGFIYLYLFASPLLIITITGLKQSFAGPAKFMFIKKARPALALLVPVMLLTLVFGAGVYHGTSPEVYLHDYPISYSDPRLPQRQWLDASEFSRPLDSINYSYGVRLAWEYMGACSYKYVNPLLYDGTLFDWSREKNDTTMIIRESMIEVPDYNGEIVTNDDFDNVVYENNVLYDNGEVLIIRTVK